MSINPDRQDKLYSMSCLSILNKSSLFRFAHYSSDLTKIILLSLPTRTPVDVFAVLELSRRDPVPTFLRFRATREPAM